MQGSTTPNIGAGPSRGSLLPDIYRHAVELSTVVCGDQEVFPPLQNPPLHLVALGGIDAHRGALGFQLEPPAVYQILRPQRHLLAEALIALLAELLDPLVRDAGIPKELSDLPGGYLQRLRYLGLLVALHQLPQPLVDCPDHIHAAVLLQYRLEGPAKGLVGDATVEENMISDRFYRPEYNHHLLLDRKKIRSEVEELIVNYGVKCDGRDALVKTLSGGNIQKVVAAREFSSRPGLLIANQPTRGIDIGASEFIRKKLVELRDEGTAVLLISADLMELLEVSDSIIVMCNGQIAAYFPRVAGLDENTLGEYMLGIKKQSAEEIGGVVFEQ